MEMFATVGVLDSPLHCCTKPKTVMSFVVANVFLDTIVAYIPNIYSLCVHVCVLTPGQLGRSSPSSCCVTSMGTRCKLGKQKLWNSRLWDFYP